MITGAPPAGATSLAEFGCSAASWGWAQAAATASEHTAVRWFLQRAF